MERLKALARKSSFAILGFALIGLAAAWHGAVGAQEPPPPAEVAQKFSTWTKTLDEISHDLNNLKLDPSQLEALSDRAVDIRSQALEFDDVLISFADEARDLRDAFNASASAGGTETADTQAEAKELEAKVAQIEGWGRQVDLTVARSDQLLDKISTRRRQQLAKSLEERGPVPLNPVVWLRAAGQVGDMARVTASGAAEQVATWVDPASPARSEAASVAVLAVAAWLAGFAATRLVARRSHPVLGPVFSGPWSVAFLDVLRPALPWLVSLAAAGFASDVKDWAPQSPARAAILAVTWTAITAAIGVWVLRATLVRPRGPLPGIAATPERRAVLSRAFGVLIALLAVDLGVQSLTDNLASPDLFAVWTLLFVVVGSLFGRTAAAAIGRSLREQPKPDGKLARFLLLVVPAVVAVVSLAATAVGYAQLGHYVFSNALATAAVLFLAWSARGIAAEVLQRACDAESPAGHVLADRFGADQSALRLVQFWLGLILDVAVPAAALLGLMVVWGTGTEDAILMTERLIDGIRVGNVTLSLADLVAAMVTFVVGVWITRLSQRILDRRVFPGTQLDLGVRNSLRSGLGYVGVIIAGAIAILALGINLSSLALVAGALSVGIGFGLQNIINNFVSGLILLIERPVKVGDWIVVGANEGVVNRINVRSTEIITAARATVLIPNADFLSASVTNWTHKDKGARVRLTFKIPGSIGAEGGRDLLLACAREIPKVLSYPPPRALLQDIGDTYTFELEADIADATTMREVASELRFAVDRALRKAKD
ncbi:MAG: DUF3772 domain-containing protein [Gemmatimonas sp.]